MAQPAQVGLEKGAQVGDAVFQHGDAVDAHAEGKALPLGRVDARRLQHLWVDHARAENLHPLVAFADLELAADVRIADVDLGRRFGEGKVAGAEPQFDGRHLKERAAEFLQAPFQVGHADVAVDRQALDLVEHGRVGLVHVHAVDAARGDHADRSALVQHRTDLHRAGMGAQHVRRAVVARSAVHEERVMFLPGGVFGRNV